MSKGISALSAQQRCALEYIQAWPGTNPSRVAAFCRMSPERAAMTVGSLVRRGLVSRLTVAGFVQYFPVVRGAL